MVMSEGKSKRMGRKNNISLFGEERRVVPPGGTPGRKFRVRREREKDSAKWIVDGNC